MNEKFTIRELHGESLVPWLDELGKLRIRVFREYPYLYEGSLEYERNYLRIYRDTPDSLVVIVTDHAGEVVGATTCLPLVDEGDELKQPFSDQGFDISSIMYFGESVLLPEWRGHGLGKVFFDKRESHAKKHGKTMTAFCAVDRPEKHPLRPADYRTMDPFWESRGYVKRPNIKTEFSWKEIGEAEESPKPLTFWTKSWDT